MRQTSQDFINATLAERPKRRQILGKTGCTQVPIRAAAAKFMSEKQGRIASCRSPGTTAHEPPRRGRLTFERRKLNARSIPTAMDQHSGR
jgi:hypothetical protein